MAVSQVTAAGSEPIQALVAALQGAAAPTRGVGQAQRLSTTANLSTAAVESTPPPFAAASSFGPNDIHVDTGETFQQFYGAGAALTDASAYNLLTHLTQQQRDALLAEMFSPTAGNLSMLRIALGSTDFQESPVYTYDEVATGQTDPGLLNFTIERETQRIIPLVRQILAINPGVKVIASVWHPPSWMLTDASDNFTNDPISISSTWLTTYATYLVKAVQAWAAFGVPIWGLCYVNEGDGGKFAMSPADQATVIKALGPALEAAGLRTKILAHDGQWDTYATYPEVILADAAAAKWTDGVAFHGYAGSPATAHTAVRRANRNVLIINTEWRSLAAESVETIMRGVAGGYIVECVENWSSGVVFWNLALDENGNPHDGYHPGRRGVVAIPSSGSGNVVRNQEFYALTHLTRYIRPGAVRCLSAGPARGPKYTAYTTYPSTLKHVAFLNTDGTVVLYAYNATGGTVQFQVVDSRASKAFPVTMVAGELATFVWGTSQQSSPAGSASGLAPTAVSVAATTAPGAATLTWVPPTSGAAVTGYGVYRDGVRVGMALPGASSWSEYVAAGTYSYTVVTETGAGAATSAPATAVVPAASAPSVPVLTLADNALGPGFVLSWTAAAPNGSAVSYALKRGTSPGAGSTIASLPAGYLTYTDSSVLPGVTYYYTITATNSTGSANSIEQSGARTGAYAESTSTSPWVSPSGSKTWTHTIAAGTPNRYVVVAVGFSGSVGFEDPILGSVTYGGQAMTRIARVAGNAGQSNNRVMDLWGLVNPPTGAQTVVASLSGGGGATSSNFFPGAISFGNVNQSTPLGTPVTASAASGNTASITTTGGATKDLVLAAVTARTTQVPLTVGASQLSQWQLNKGDNTQACVTTQTGGTGNVSAAFSWPSNDVYAAAAVAVKGA